MRYGSRVPAGKTDNEGVNPEAIYRERSQRFAVERDRQADRSRRIAYARVTIFGAAAVALIWALATSESVRFPLVLSGGVLLVGFAALVVHHARVERQQVWFDALWRTNQEAAARVRRAWDELPIPSIRAEPHHPYAGDLDLFGRASVFQWLGPATGPGESTLAGWLLAPSAPDAIRERHRAVKELAPLLDLRQQIAAHGRLSSGVSRADVERFLAWSEEAPWLIPKRWLVWIARIIAVAGPSLVALHVAGLIEVAAWAVPAAASLALMALFEARVLRALEHASGADQAFARYADLFELVGDVRFESPALRRIQGELSWHDRPAHLAMRRLDRIQGFANLRLSAAILHFPVQVLTLWDFHVLDALERWREEAGSHARRWLAALGEADAMAALAGALHDEPEWALPEIPEREEAAGPMITATALGHPLIPQAARVPNDVEIGPPGTVLFVTGSNMSGKSTLLRAIGVNVVLAQAGGPVCARAMRVPPVRVETSMRVQDSLEEGVSYFMAALQRLKEIVEASRAPGDRRTLLYLLDEILQGTNTAERQIATRTILGHLLAYHAIGAITSHDLSLVEAPELAGSSRAVHFTETVHDEREVAPMTFDYRLRPGVATSRNALRLMKLIGISDP